jgi:hypothetical protein
LHQVLSLVLHVGCNTSPYVLSLVTTKNLLQ